MFKKLGFLACLLAVALIASPASAAVFGSAGSGPLQGVLNSITQPQPGGVSSVDVTTDDLADSLDSYWSISASGTSAAQIIVELAGLANTNKFGIYDRVDSTKKVQIFDGAASAGAKAAITFDIDGSVILSTLSAPLSIVDTNVIFAGNLFGYYLETSPNAIWYSDTTLNWDGLDHMLAYQGKGTDLVKLPANPTPSLWTANEWILAFEDLPASSTDGDYTDFVVMVESVYPIPEPAAVLVWGFLAAVGICLYRRRK